MKKEIFKEGDRVFDFSSGWGVVNLIDKAAPTLKVMVKWDSGQVEQRWYTQEGRKNEHSGQTLSFTEYDLVSGGFSQERLFSPEEYIGKLVFLSDQPIDLTNLKRALVCELKAIGIGTDPYIDGYDNSWKYIQPITQEVLNILAKEIVY